jgi:hypothetical protein
MFLHVYTLLSLQPPIRIYVMIFRNVTDADRRFYTIIIDSVDKLI